MKKILIIENNHKLDRYEQCVVFNYLDTLPNTNYDVIDFSCFKSKTDDEVWNAVNECDDILCQTAVSNGSEYQLKQMVSLLAKIKESKNIYLCILGDDMFSYMNEQFKTSELLSINHHNLYELDYEGTVKKMDFSYRINKYLQKLADEQKYRDKVRTRPTGRKIKILACNATGTAFKGLPIGEVVDELDMSDQDPNKNRGVWVWGNGEPVKLVSDLGGLKEYELAGDLTVDDVLELITKSTDLKTNKLSHLQLRGMISVIEDKEINTMGIANYICEETNIEKRGNRAVINQILTQYRKNE
jgi:hypothetical protein